MDVKIENSWKNLLAPEFEKEYFLKLTQFVKNEYTSFPVYPKGSQIFHAFDICPFEKVKVDINKINEYINYYPENTRLKIFNKFNKIYI